MSQPRSEFYNPEQRSIPETNNTNAKSTEPSSTTNQPEETIPTWCQTDVGCSTLSSCSSTPDSSRNKSRESLAGASKCSDLSGDPGSREEEEFWKTETVEDEDLTTSADVSSASPLSSDSSPEIRARTGDNHSSLGGSDESYLKEEDQLFSDEFETEEEDSEEESESSSNISSSAQVRSDPREKSRDISNTIKRFSETVARKQKQTTGPLLPAVERENRSRRRINLLRRLDNFLHRMSVKVAKYHKELCIVFLILASGIASLKSSPAKIRATSVPGPFFEDKDVSYFVQDNYMGEYVDLANKQIPYYPSFLFYYAPWDSESVASKSVFLNVAKHFFFTYHGRVKFVAINCWWPGGQCRKNYKNLSHYPIFVAHVGKSPGIIYNGPIRLEPMIKFINSLLKPLTRIDNEEELWRFRSQHDVIMLAYFNFTMENTSEAYETYLQMALRTYEADPFNQVGFGIFLRPELAEKFFLTSSNAISLVLFNEIHTAKWHGGYSAQSLKGPVGQVAEWIIERTKSVPVTWVYALRNGFANRPIALGPHDFAQQLSKGPVLLLVTRRYFPSGLSPFYMQVKEVALDYFNCNKSGNVTKLRRTTHKVNSEWASLMSSVVQVCRQKASFQCQQLMPNINHWEKKRPLFKRESLFHYENVSSALNFTGFSCISDRQFKFLAVDPVDVPYFVRLGLSRLKNVDDETTDFTIDPMAFIIDSHNDVILPLPSLNITDIAMAIHNYTNIVENMDNRLTHPSNVFLSDKGMYKGRKDVGIVIDGKGSDVLENWGSADLMKYVLGKSDREQSVLLIYTASFCGFCSVAVTHFVALSRFLVDNYNGDLKVKLAKIDMFRNSLPPNLSPERLPMVIFIPSWNRSDIRMYPESQEISSQGLLRFILSELDPKTRVQASLMSPLCGPSGKHCSTKSDSEQSCDALGSRMLNSTSLGRVSCIKAGRSYVSNQIELLLQKLQEGEEAMFLQANDTFHPLTTQAWNGRLLDRLRTMAVTLDVS